MQYYDYCTYGKLYSVQMHLYKYYVLSTHLQAVFNINTIKTIIVTFLLHVPKYQYCPSLLSWCLYTTYLVGKMFIFRKMKFQCEVLQNIYIYITIIHVQYIIQLLCYETFVVHIAVKYLQGLDRQYKLLSHQSDVLVVAHHVPVCVKCIRQ